MAKHKTRLYLAVVIASTAGYGWFFYHLWFSTNQTTLLGCPIKKISGLPCPSCGSTRAVLSLYDGHLWQSLLINPIGILIAAIMLIAPLWIIFDWTTKQSSFWQFYIRVENFLRQKRVATVIILLFLINWIWNINKGL